jgi:hypothetical protein
MKRIEQKVKELPPDLQKEVLDYIEFLLSKKVLKTNKKPRLSWFGGLREYRNQFTSLELQHKATLWRD